MSWNYRIMRQDHAPEGKRPDVLYQIHEVHYEAGGKVSWWTETPASVVADTRDEILNVLAMMADALGHPVLCFKTGRSVEDAKILSDDMRQALRATAEYFERDDGKFVKVGGSQDAGEPPTTTRSPG